MLPLPLSPLGSHSNVSCSSILQLFFHHATSTITMQMPVLALHSFRPSLTLQPSNSVTARRCSPSAVWRRPFGGFAETASVHRGCFPSGASRLSHKSFLSPSQDIHILYIILLLTLDIYCAYSRIEDLSLQVHVISFPRKIP